MCYMCVCVNVCVCVCKCMCGYVYVCVFIFACCFCFVYTKCEYAQSNACCDRWIVASYITDITYITDFAAPEDN